MSTALPLNQLSATDAAAAIAAGKLTSEALVAACLERIEDRESAVQAWACIDPDLAMKQARACDRQASRSRLHGIPVGIKDVIDTCDLPTEYGSPIYKDHRPACDAACVAQVRELGGVILGKTVSTEFATRHPNKTRNPFNPQRTPGGSSSGSAAAVGAGMLPVALGTQTQGSTLRPASYCGIVGFKPTHGVLTMQGVHPISHTHDHMGVLGGTLEDAWRIASHISLASGNPGQAFLQRAADKPPRPLKPKRLLRLYTEGWEQETGPATRAAFEALLKEMERSGIEIVGRDNHSAAVELEQTLSSGFVERSLDITAYEMKWPYQQYVAAHGALIEKRVHERMAQAQALHPADYAARLAEKAATRKKVKNLMRGCDGIVTLAASGPAPVGLGHTGSRAFLVHATFLGLPAFSLPLMRVDNMPLGLQLIGAAGKDGALCAHAHWMMRQLGT